MAMIVIVQMIAIRGRLKMMLEINKSEAIKIPTNTNQFTIKTRACCSGLSSADSPSLTTLASKLFIKQEWRMINYTFKIAHY